LRQLIVDPLQKLFQQRTILLCFVLFDALPMLLACGFLRGPFPQLLAMKCQLCLEELGVTRVPALQPALTIETVAYRSGFAGIRICHISGILSLQNRELIYCFQWRAPARFLCPTICTVDVGCWPPA
jgi:hypothetical protein